MKYSDFEKHITQELSNASEPVHMDALLDSLNLEKPERKSRRKGFPIWILSSVLLLASIASFMAMDGSIIGINSNGNEKLASNDLDLTSQLNKSKKSITEENDQKALNELDHDESKLNKYNLDNPAAKNKPYTLTTNTEEISVQSRGDLILERTFEKVISHSQLHEKEPAPATPIVTKGSFSNFSSSVNSESNFSSTSSSQRSESFGSQYSMANVGSDETKSYYKPNRTVSSARKSIDIASLSETLNSRTTELQFADIDKVDDALFSRMKINCPSFNQAFWRLALVPEVGAFVPFKRLEYKSNETSFAYDQRVENEKSLEGLNVGLYGMLVRDRLPIYLKAGISYTRIAERIELEYTDTTYITEKGIISSTVSANGDTITHVYGDVISEKIDNVKRNTHSYIHLFDMPISLGYNTYAFGLDIGIEGGVKVNLMTRATGNLFTAKGEFTNLSLNPHFKPRIGLSYFGGLMIGRNFGRFGDFYLSPRFNYYPHDFTSDINLVSQKYISVGINAGFIYKIK